MFVSLQYYLIIIVNIKTLSLISFSKTTQSPFNLEKSELLLLKSHLSKSRVTSDSNRFITYR